MDEPLYPFRTLASSSAFMVIEPDIRVRYRVSDRFLARKGLISTRGPQKSGSVALNETRISDNPKSATGSTYGPVRLRKRFLSTRHHQTKKGTGTLTRSAARLSLHSRVDATAAVRLSLGNGNVSSGSPSRSPSSPPPKPSSKPPSSLPPNPALNACLSLSCGSPVLSYADASEQSLSSPSNTRWRFDELFVDVGSEMSKDIDLAKRGMLLQMQTHLRKQKDDQVANFDPAPGGVLKPFAIYRPNGFISMKNYMKRIEELADEISPTMFIAAVVYMDRCHQKNPQSVKINHFTIHKLFFTSLLIACQYWEDNNYQLSFMAKVGGVSLREMKFLQGKFLELVQFDLEISAGVWTEYVQQAIAVYRQEQEKQKNALLVV